MANDEGLVHDHASSEDYCGGPHRITGPNRVTLRFNEPWHVYPNDGRYRSIHIDGEPAVSIYEKYSRGQPLEGWCANAAGYYIPECPSEYVSLTFRGPPVGKGSTGRMHLYMDQFTQFNPCSNWNPHGEGTSATAVFLRDGQVPEFRAGPGSYLDLGGGFVHLEFDEWMRASSVAPANLSVGYVYRFWQTDEVRLGGATVASGDGSHVRLNLTAAQVGNLTRVIMGSPYIAQFGGSLPAEVYGSGEGRVFAALRGAFATDLAGNPAVNRAQFHAIALRPDLEPPALAGPAVLDMAALTLSLPFDSHMDAARAGGLSGIALRGSSGASVPLAGAGPVAAAEKSLNVTLAPGHVAAAAEIAAAGRGPSGIDVPGGALFDYGGNAFAGVEAWPLVVVPDASAPSLDASAGISLHLASGRMDLRFSETVDASSADPGGIQVRSALRGDGALDVGLGGAAAIAGGDGELLELTLTPAQRVEIAEYHKRPPGGGAAHLQVHVGAGAVSDPSGNPVLDATAGLAIDPLGVPPLLRAGGGGEAGALDLSAGTLSLSFDSAVDVQKADPSALAIGDGGAWSMPLGGAAVADRGEAGIEVALTRAQRDAAVLAATAAAPGRLLLDVGEGAFRGALHGNAYPGGSGLRLSVAPDGDPPAPAAGARPGLDAASRKLTVVFSETVDASSANASLFRLGGAGEEARASLAGAAASTADSTALVLTLTPAQDALAIGAHARSGGLRLDMGAGAVADLAGNPAAAASGMQVGVQADRSRPHLDGAPVVDLARGLITVRLHEYVDVSEVHARLMSLSWWPRTSIPLDGAQVVTTEDGPAFTVRLVPAQHDQMARNRNYGLTLTLGDGAVTDLSGNRIARTSTGTFSFANASTSPGLAGPPAAHVLDMSAGTATFRFNETMDASLADPSLVNITAPGAAPVPLAGAEALAPFQGRCGGVTFGHDVLLGAGINSQCGSDAVVLDLTSAQSAALSHALAGQLAPGGGPRAGADMAAGAFADTRGHATADGARGVPLAVEADERGPAANGTFRSDTPVIFYPGGNTLGKLWSLARYNERHGIEPDPPVLNMSDGTLAFPLDEHVDGRAADPSRVSVANATGGSAVALGRAAGPQADTDRPALRLGADLKAAVAGLAASQGPVRIDADTGAFADLWGNPSLPMLGVRPEVVADEAGPAPDPLHPPVLDLAGGTLSVWLDEYVNGSLTDPSAVGVVVAGDPPARVQPGAGAEAGNAGPGQGDRAQFALSAAQKHAAAVAGAAAAAAAGSPPGAAVTLDAGAGAFTDTAGNPSPPALGVAVAVRADDRPPALGSTGGAPPAALDLSAGTLAFSFDEYVNASATNPQAVSLSNATGGDRTRLGGAGIAAGSPPAADTVALLLAPEHLGAAARLAAAGQLRVGAAEGAFADAAGNAFAGASGLPVQPAPDAAAPRLLGDAGAHRIELGGEARLVLAFDENVDAPAVNASGIRVSAPGGAGPGALRGAAVEQAWPGTTVSVRLTAEQAAAAAWAHRHSPGPLKATVTAAAGVADLAGNALAAPAEAALEVVPGGPGDDGPLIGPRYYVPVRAHALDVGSANRSAPGHVAVGPGGIYATDGEDGRIEVVGRGEGAARRVIEAAGWLESVDQVAVLPDGTVVARSPALAADGNLTVIDGGAGEPRALRAGSGGGDDPLALAAGPGGRLVVGSEDGMVRVLNATTGATLLEFGGAGLGSGAGGGRAFSNITGVAAGPGGRIAVSDGTTGRVQLYLGNGSFLAAAGNATDPAGAGEGQFDGPRGVAIGPGGRVLVADTGNGRIQAFNADGAFAAELGRAGWGGTGPPVSIAAGPGGRLFVADARGAQAGAVVELERFDPPDVRALDPDGPYGEGRTVRIAAEFGAPARVEGANASLALDSGGEGGDGDGGPAAAWYRSGNNTRTLEFVYHVGRGHSSADLSALSLGAAGEGGRIVVGGQVAGGELAGPGEPRSLSRNSDIAVETVRPNVTRVTAGVPDGFYGRGAEIPITVWFSEPVSTGTAMGLTLATGASSTTTVRANGTAGGGGHAGSVNFTYRVGPGDDTRRLGYASSGALAADNPDAVADAAGNRADLALPEPGADGSLREGHMVQAVGSVVHAGVVSAEVTGAHEVTVTYSAALDADAGDYTGLVLFPSGARPPVTGLAGSGTAAHTVSFGDPAAGAEDTASVDVAALRGNDNHHSFPGAEGLRVADGQRPTVASAAAVAPDRIRVVFSEHVDATAPADPAAAWSLSGPGAAGLSVSASPTIDGADRTVLSLSGNVTGTAPDVSLSYSAAAGDVADAAGDRMEDQGPVAVADALPPVFTAAAVAPDRIRVEFSERVDAAVAADPAAAWSLSGPDATGLSVSASPPVGNASHAVLELSGSMPGTAPDVSLSYSAAAGDVADAAGDRMEDQGPVAVADALPPVFTAAAVAPDRIRVEFSEPVTSGGGAGAAAAWELSGPDAAGLSVLSSPAIDGADRTVLSLSGNVTGTSPDASLSYSAAAGDIADAAGNRPVPAGEAGASATAVADGLAPLVLRSAITGPRQATVEYSEPAWAGQSAYRSVAVGSGAPRPVEGLSGNGTAEHTVSFGGEPAAPGSTGRATVDATAVTDLAAPRPNALGASESLALLLEDGQGPSIVSAAVTGPRSATVLYDRAASAAPPGDARPAYAGLVVDGEARPITGHSGLAGSDEHVLEFGGEEEAGTGATGSVAVDPGRVSGGDGGGLLGPGTRLEVALSDGQAPRVASAVVSGPDRATVRYSEPAWAARAAYLGLEVGGEARPVVALSGSGTAEHVIRFGGGRAASDAEGSAAVNATAVTDLAAPRPNALGPPGQLALRLGDGQGPALASALVTGPREVTVRYDEPAVAAPGAYSSLEIGGEERAIAGSHGLGGSAEHVLEFRGAAAASGAAGSVAVDPARISDGGGSPMGTGAPFAHALGDGQGPALASAAVTGPREVTVLYDEPAWATRAAYPSLEVGGEARPVVALSGAGAAEHVIAFGGEPAEAGAAGELRINATEVTDLALPLHNGLGAGMLTVALGGHRAAAAEAAFTGPNKVRIEYSAPLGPPAGHRGPVYGGVSAAGGEGAAPVPGGVSGLGTAVHTVRFGGGGVAAHTEGSIALNVDLRGAAGGARYEFAAGPIAVGAGEATRTLAPGGASPVVEIERDGFVRAVDASGAGGSARLAINVSGLGRAAGEGGGTVTFPADGGDGVRMIASFAEVRFPPGVTASRVPADGLIELYVPGRGQPGPGSLLWRVAAALGEDAAGIELLRAVEVGGHGGARIEFDLPVRVLLAGQAGGVAFYANGTGGEAVRIAAACAADDTAAVHAQLGGAGECQLDSGADKVVHTYHLTLFGTARPAPGAAGTCGAALEPPEIGLGSVQAGARSAAASQEVRGAGTLPIASVSVGAADWTDGSGRTVMPAGATSVRAAGAAGEWTPLGGGEVDVPAGGSGRVAVEFLLDVPPGALQGGAAGVLVSQAVTYTVSCSAPG